VLGWCDDMAGLMRASDVVVTKAGSVTLAEAWSQGRPALVYHVFPGQEEGNVAPLERDGGGQYVPAVEALPAAVLRLHGRACAHSGIHNRLVGSGGRPRGRRCGRRVEDAVEVSPRRGRTAPAALLCQATSGYPADRVRSGSEGDVTDTDRRHIAI